MHESGILYPWASYNGDIVNILNAERGGIFQCLTCQCRMIARQGQVKSWHFAHHNATDANKCDPDLALHKQEELAFEWQLVTAQNLAVFYPCLNCGQKAAAALRCKIPPDVTVTREDRKACPPAIVDMAVYSKGRLWFIVEIVNTHWPEPKTRQLLADTGRPVFIVKVDQNDLTERQKKLRIKDTHMQIIAEEVINPPLKGRYCTMCNSESARAKRRSAATRESLRRSRTCPECGGEKSPGAWACRGCSDSPWYCSCGNRKSPEYAECYDCGYTPYSEHFA